MMTARQAAEAIGCSHRTVQRVSANHDIGTQLANGARIFDEADVEKLRGLCRTVGNPNFVIGNFYRKKKMASKKRTK